MRGAVSLIASTIIFTSASPQLPPDPIGDFDFPDPAAVYHDGTYYAYGGSKMMTSSDLTNWSNRRPYLSSSPKWAKPDSMGGAPSAPIFLHEKNLWALTFQAEEASCQRPVCSCISVAFAESPAGPFMPLPVPLQCMPEHDGAIDASARIIDGVPWIFWKSTGYNTKNRPSELWVARFISPRHLPPLMGFKTEQWESRYGIGCIEAPSYILIGGKKFLFYSGGDWTAGLSGLPYSIGYAECDRNWNCNKVTTDNHGPWFGPSYNDSVGTGGQEFFTDEAGEVWMVFHAWDKGKAGYQNGGSRKVRFYPLKMLPSL
eukprot:UC4_evm4s317